MDSNQSPIEAQTIGGFLAELSAKVPTPGGGAAAALTGATAAATAGMVVIYSINKKSHSEHKAFNIDAQKQLDRARAMFLTLGDEDAAGYSVLNTLWKLEKDHPDRIAGWEDAVTGAIGPPRAMVALSVEVLRLSEQLITTTNRQLKSDLGVAAVLGQAAARSAAWNVKINIPLLPADEQEEAHKAVDALLSNADSLCQTIEAGCA